MGAPNVRRELSLRTRLLFIAAVAAATVSLASVAWACVPQGTLVIDPASGPPGTQVMATTGGFPIGETVQIRWNTLDGPIIGTGTGPSFTKPVTIPQAPPQGYVIIAAVTGDHAEHSAARAGFTIPGAVDPPPDPTPDPPGDPDPPQVPAPKPTPKLTPAIPTNPLAPLVSKGKTITGTSGKDKLVGTRFADVIKCGAGDDVVDAGAGDDVISCGAGKDRVNGGPGKDRVSGGNGNDRLTGGTGNDKLSGGAGKDMLKGGSGADTLRGNGGRDKLFGGPGNDVLFRGAGDLLSGGSGKNRMRG